MTGENKVRSTSRALRHAATIADYPRVSEKLEEYKRTMAILKGKLDKETDEDEKAIIADAMNFLKIGMKGMLKDAIKEKAVQNISKLEEKGDIRTLMDMQRGIVKEGSVLDAE